MIISDFSFESRLTKGGYESIIGIDEAGRGPLAGPVVAGAVVLKKSDVLLGHRMSKLIQNDNLWDLVRDSKTLSEKQRKKAFNFIQKNFWVGIGVCDHETIDRMNILEASFLAMKKAVGSLERAISNLQSPIYNQFSNSKTQTEKKIFLLDGNKKIPNFSGTQKAIIGGDKHVKSISAASIVAKVTRDRIMFKAHAKYPQYNFDRHKGYGTRLHFEMLREHGPCEIHRQSFKPVSNLAKRRV